MRNSSTSNAGSDAEAILKTQEQTDALIATVREKLAQRGFQKNNFNESELLQQMVESFADSRGMVRLTIAEMLGEIGQPALPILLDALENHSNPVVRRASGKTITLIADPVSIPTLVRALLHDEDTVVKGSAAGALARMGEKAVPVLLDIIASSEHPQSIKGHAAWALAFMGAEIREQLYAAISSDSAEVRCAIASAIGNVVQETKDTEGLNLLIAVLQDSEAMVRAEAATAMSQLDDDPKLISALIDSLSDRDGEVRKNVAFALMKLGDRRALHSLQAAFDLEPEADIKKAIAVAISRLENKLDDDDDELS